MFVILFLAVVIVVLFVFLDLGVVLIAVRILFVVTVLALPEMKHISTYTIPGSTYHNIQ